jgi:protease-4
MTPLSRRSRPILLELDLTQPLIQTEPDDPVGKLRSRGKPRLAKVMRALDAAGDDPRVVGLIAKIGGKHLELAIAHEIRQAVARFGASGKPTVAWAETFGDDGNGTVPYFLASGFGEIWLQPSGDLGLMGVMTEVTFLRGALDLLGVEPQLDRRYEYKNAWDRIMRTEFSDAHHESADRLVESAWETIVAEISASRGLTPDQLRALADRAPFSVDEAIESKLIDRAGYRDEVYSDVRRRVGPDVQLLFASRWSKKTPLPEKVTTAVTSRNQPVVALVEARGTIVTGASRRSPIDGQQLGSDTLSAALRAAREDDKVRAVVFRVDSPGGSAVASDTVWREVSLLREAGKPVVVSMGAVAGSGGYFIACPADVIVAQPTTLTGSIGVVGGKAVVSGLMDKVGLSTGAVSRGARARMYSARVGFTDDDRELMSKFLDRIYDDFVGKVAAGRSMTRDQVHEIAKGRVWTGADGARNGLVDSLGGMKEALAIARERAGLDDKAPLVPAIRIPLIKKLGSPKSTDDPRAVTMSLSLGGWGDLTSIATSLGLPAAGPLMMTDVRLR